MRATAMASPFLESVASMRVAWVEGEEKMRDCMAVALRGVGSLWEMETMWAAPEAVRCVSFGDDGGSVDGLGFREVEGWSSDD